MTASTDGTCIVWDLEKFSRKLMVLANTLFQCVCYHPDGFQVSCIAQVNYYNTITALYRRIGVVKTWL